MGDVRAAFEERNRPSQVPGVVRDRERGADELLQGVQKVNTHHHSKTDGGINVALGQAKTERLRGQFFQPNGPGQHRLKGKSRGLRQ